MRRAFLFLQGPLAPLYARLADALEAKGHGALRINLCVGDALLWRRTGALFYRGPIAGWPHFVRRTIRRHAITDLILHGECRDYHRLAAREARRLGVRVIVTELGYLRPDWMTIELDGTGAASHFPRDPKRILDMARQSPAIDLSPRFSSHFSRVAIPDVVYNLVNTLLWFCHPHYRRHTIYFPPWEYAAWLVRLATSGARNRRARTVRGQLAARGRPYFIFALQLEGDFQVRARSPFRSQAPALEAVFASFRAHAPEDCLLVVKSHPLDNGLENWSALIDALRRTHGIEHRVIFVDGDRLEPLLAGAWGLITINSSAGLDAIRRGCPTKTLAPAIYDVAGMTHGGPLDGFWRDPQRPDPELATAFVRALANATQVRGTIYSDEGLSAAVTNMTERILSGQLESLFEAS